MSIPSELLKNLSPSVQLEVFNNFSYELLARRLSELADEQKNEIYSLEEEIAWTKSTKGKD